MTFSSQDIQTTTLQTPPPPASDQTWYPDWNEAEDNLARMMANVRRRGESLFTDGGYTAIKTMDTENFAAFHVQKPKRGFYTVRVSKLAVAPGTKFFGSWCSCPFFAQHLTCKHLIACEQEVAREQEGAGEAAQCEEYDALHGGAESDEYGCDPHAEY